MFDVPEVVMTLLCFPALLCLACFHGCACEEPTMPVPGLLPLLLPLSGSQTVEAAGPGQRLLAAFLAGRNPQTLRAYRQDLADFAGFVGVASAAEAAQQLLADGAGTANAQALAYKADLLGRGLAAATVNRRLAALRSLLKLARTLGLAAWSLEVEGLRAEAYRDTRGPGTAGFRRLLDQLAGRTDRKALHDRALLRLLFDLGLRRSEVVRLDLADLDRERGTLAVLGKGRTAKVKLTLPPQTQAALEDWLALRGLGAGPLFRSLDRARKGDGRLTGAGLYALVRRLGEQAGLKVWPHGLRHAAITQALDATGGDVRAVQRFSRHRDLRTLLLYDDRRADLAGDVARRVAAAA
jgi:integrase/recombinase XerC